MRTSGRAWCFGDKVDTDTMMPGQALQLEPAEALPLLFNAIRPGWSGDVSEGDVVVGGWDFGIGSARPVASLLRVVGIRTVLAEHMASLFQRNSINAGVLALIVPGISSLLADGDPVTVNTDEMFVRNDRTREHLVLAPLPSILMDVVSAGGLLAQLRRDGYLASGEARPVLNSELVSRRPRPRNRPEPS